MSTIIDHQLDIDREREGREARAEVLRRAELQGVEPVNSLEDFVGDSQITADFDVDEFLRQVREVRDLASTRSE
jgi:hypothetical protein